MSHSTVCGCKCCEILRENQRLKSELESLNKVAEDRREQRDKLKKELAHANKRIDGLICMLEHHGHRFNECKDTPKNECCHQHSSKHDHHDRCCRGHI